MYDGNGKHFYFSKCLGEAHASEELRHYSEDRFAHSHRTNHVCLYWLLCFSLVVVRPHDWLVQSAFFFFCLEGLQFDSEAR